MEIRVSTEDIETPLHRPPPTNLKIKALVVLVLAAVAVAGGLMIRAHNQSELQTLATQQELSIVKVIRPIGSTGSMDLILPGTLQAYYSASVYSRVTGYLKAWDVDIGASVKSGQVLATIETPELDQQLKQSEANLQSALANERLTKITSDRWKNLLKTDSVSKQETDEKIGDYEAKQALVVAAKADVDRLLALEAFKRITAPFDGVVTERNTDVGALINAGHDAGHRLFTVDDVHKLRLYVNVPQSYSHQITAGMKAQFDIPAMPGKLFNAVLTGNSRAINATSGTMLVELEVDNADRKLMPGGYGNVHFDMPREAHIVQIPATALVFRKEGMAVATLTPDNRVAFRSIQISHDLGASIEVAAGINADDRIIDSPPDSLEQGDQVRIADASRINAAKGTAK
jgi:RND family efflux transporter MFP subunit